MEIFSPFVMFRGCCKHIKKLNIAALFLSLTCGLTFGLYDPGVSEVNGHNTVT